MMKLAGKTALITGGSSGIGLAAAKLFLAQGARVAVTGRSPESLATARVELGEQTLVLQSDTSSLAEIRRLMDTLRNAFGHLDILVLNAGVATPAPLAAVSEDSFDGMLNTNFKGVFFTLQQALTLLRDGGAVVVTTSITNQLGSANFSVYAACKAALRSLVASLALELIPRGIRVNAVSPGPIATPMFDRLGLSDDLNRANRERIQGKSPIRRFGAPEEVANAILFLASDDASYMVGEEIVVDGGMSLL
jgi:NAD(P)-dependent dehydrogenase (short-subunit alcohol dehydrogenase family)